MNHIHLWNRRPATLLAIAAALIFALLPLDAAGAHQGHHGRASLRPAPSRSRSSRQRTRPRPRQARPDGDDPEPLSGLQPRPGARSDNPGSIRRSRRADLRDRAVHELPRARRSDRRRDRGKGTGPDRPAGGHEVDDRRLEPAPRLRLPRDPAKRSRRPAGCTTPRRRSRTTRKSARRRSLSRQRCCQPRTDDHLLGAARRSRRDPRQRRHAGTDLEQPAKRALRHPTGRSNRRSARSRSTAAGPASTRS